MRFLRYSKALPRNETPEQRQARLERLCALRELPVPPRVRIGSYPCGCGSAMDVYDGDARA